MALFMSLRATALVSTAAQRIHPTTGGFKQQHLSPRRVSGPRIGSSVLVLVGQLGRLGAGLSAPSGTSRLQGWGDVDSRAAGLSVAVAAPRVTPPGVFLKEPGLCGSWKSPCSPPVRGPSAPSLLGRRGEQLKNGELPCSSSGEGSAFQRSSSQEYWSGLPFPSPGDLPNPGFKPSPLYCRQILYHLSHQGSPAFYTGA